ncbi:MAG: hypothetical protein MN733_13815 [Nitrososphaera sp.]|nr:hypothetical protein [Nitrososphaera sp.]
MDRATQKLEEQAAIITRRQLMLDMLEGKVRMPLDIFEMKIWLSDCGTAGCAIGNYCSLKQVKEEGLIKLERKSYNNPQPAYKNKDGMFAVAEYFGISGIEAKYVFDPDNLSNPIDIACRLREVIKS